MSKVQANLNTLTYEIDDDFKITNFNERVKEVFKDVKIGSLCHKALFGFDDVCPDCPLRSGSAASRIHYVEEINEWFNALAASNGSKHSIIMNYANPDNMNLYYNFSYNTMYEELITLNFTKMYYKIFATKKNDFKDIPKEGYIKDNLDDIRMLVHPDDIKSFIDFFNYDYIVNDMKERNSHGITKIFRRMKKDGNYGFQRVRLTFVEQEGLKDIIALIYLHEVDKINVSAKDALVSPLTGLYNNTKFREVANNYLQDRKYIDTNTKLCLMSIDIDEFKLINESFGYQKGDELLISIANKLDRCRRLYGGVVGHINADDFLYLGFYDREIIDEIQSQLKSNADLIDKNLIYKLSFGIYVIDDNSENVASMQDKSAMALKYAKENHLQEMTFDSKKCNDYVEEFQLISSIRNGLENKEFIFYVQPKYDMKKKKVIGAEALVRWNHENTIISPGRFISTMENKGMISDLDTYIWEAVCKFQRNWIDSGKNPIPISVNVSRIDMININVREKLNDLVDKYQIDRKYLEIEITESAYAENYDKIKETIQGLRQDGFRILMDDFGSGYSSLNMLNEIDVDVVKMDMKFLKDIEENRAKTIIESLIQMVKKINKPIIFEGVETKAHVDLLKKYNVNFVQGYYFYKPMPVEEFREIVK